MAISGACTLSQRCGQSQNREGVCVCVCVCVHGDCICVCTLFVCALTSADRPVITPAYVAVGDTQTADALGALQLVPLVTWEVHRGTLPAGGGREAVSQVVRHTETSTVHAFPHILRCYAGRRPQEGEYNNSLQRFNHLQPHCDSLGVLQSIYFEFTSW